MKKRLTVLALAFAMVLTMSASVFAEDTTPMNVALTKQLKIAEGIPVPSEAFTFAVTPAKAGNPYETEKAYESNAQKYPTVSFANISFTDSDRGTSTKDTLVKESTVDVASLDFPHAGLYVYEIKENEGALKNSGMTYDKNKVYYLKVFVKNGENGPYVANTEVTDGTNKKNADPNAEEPGENQPVPENKEATGEFRFENTYAKMITKHDEPEEPNPEPTNPDDPDDPTPINKEELTTDTTSAFELDKFVLGEYGDQQKAFEFTVTVELPTVGVPEGFDPKEEGNFTGTWGEDNKVTLKHGETFSIKQLPMGTKVTVAEPNPGTGYHDNWTTSEENDATTVIVGENGAYSICRNAFEDSEVTPTGIIINNLPYVLLIGIALGGIVLFTRKRRYE